jgi:hypothetical protein
MSLTLRAALLSLFVSICCQAQTRALALYAVPAKGLDAEATASMQAELQRLVNPAGLEITWKSSRNSPADFDLVVVGSFQGSCSTRDANAAIVETASLSSLGDTSISNGRILPFFHIDCTVLVRMLGRGTDGPTIGRALARVVAHELYHIIANTTAHHDTGVAKPVFSIRDLTTPHFELDMWSAAEMRPPAPVAGISEAESSGR